MKWEGGMYYTDALNCIMSTPLAFLPSFAAVFPSRSGLC